MLRVHINRTETGRINLYLLQVCYQASTNLATRQTEGKTAVTASLELLQALLFQKHLQEQSWLFLWSCLQTRTGNGQCPGWAYTSKQRLCCFTELVPLPLHLLDIFPWTHKVTNRAVCSLSCSWKQRALFAQNRLFCGSLCEQPLPHVLKFDFKSFELQLS